MNTKEKVDALIHALSKNERAHHENAQALEERKQAQDPGDIMYHSLENAEYYFKGKEEATQEATNEVMQTFDARADDPAAWPVSRLLHRLALEDQDQEILVNTPTGLMRLSLVSAYTDTDGRVYTTLEVA